MDNLDKISNNIFKYPDNIKLICEGCSKVHFLKRTSEIPKHISILRSNWCPTCEDNATSDYEEWHSEEENKIEAEKIPIAPNQLNLF